MSEIRYPDCYEEYNINEVKCAQCRFNSECRYETEKGKSEIEKLDAIQVLRVTAGGVTEVKFDVKATKFLVKNFSGGNIFVGFKEDLDESKCPKISKNFYQIVTANLSNDIIDLDRFEDYETDTIYVKGSGEVEVQALCYR